MAAQRRRRRHLPDSSDSTEPIGRCKKTQASGAQLTNSGHVCGVERVKRAKRSNEVSLGQERCSATSLLGLVDCREWSTTMSKAVQRWEKGGKGDLHPPATDK
jgi:hypothetical protein